jgi:hypothetical protein
MGHLPAVGALEGVAEGAEDGAEDGVALGAAGNHNAAAGD